MHGMDTAQRQGLRAGGKGPVNNGLNARTTPGYFQRPVSPVRRSPRLACEDNADAVVKAVRDGSLADDVVAGGAVGVGHVVQRPRHAQVVALAVGL